MGGQAGLPATGSDQSALSNTSLPAFGNQPTLPQNITSATGKFDIEPAVKPAVNSAVNLRSTAVNPAVRQQQHPFASSSPAFSQPALQAAPGRYPLGINGGLPNTPSTNQTLLSNPLPTSPNTYEDFTNGAGTPVGTSTYPGTGVSLARPFHNRFSNSNLYPVHLYFVQTLVTALRIRPSVAAIMTAV